MNQLSAGILWQESLTGFSSCVTSYISLLCSFVFSHSLHIQFIIFGFRELLNVFLRKGSSAMVQAIWCKLTCLVIKSPLYVLRILAGLDELLHWIILVLKQGGIFNQVKIYESVRTCESRTYMLSEIYLNQKYIIHIC